MDLGLVIPELEESYQRGEFYRKVETLQEAEIQNNRNTRFISIE